MPDGESPVPVARPSSVLKEQDREVGTSTRYRQVATTAPGSPVVCEIFLHIDGGRSLSDEAWSSVTGEWQDGEIDYRRERLDALPKL
jgi:hypothetical protein